MYGVLVQRTESIGENRFVYRTKHHLWYNRDRGCNCDHGVSGKMSASEEETDKGPIQDEGGVDFFDREPAERGARTATAPSPKYVSVASHVSARTI